MNNNSKNISNIQFKLDYYSLLIIDFSYFQLRIVHNNKTLKEKKHVNIKHMNQSSESEDSFKKKACQITHKTSEQVLQNYEHDIKKS